MAVTLTREMVNQYSTAVTSGSTPPNLFIRDVPDFIPIIGRTDTPFIKTLKDGGTTNILANEYGQGDLAPRDGVLGAAVADTSTTSFTVDDYKKFQLWDVILVDSEEVQVTADPASNALTVSRHFAGTTAATHSNGAAYRILGPAVPEGADSPSSPVAQGETFVNYPQIFEYTWSYTHRSRVTPTYEVKTDRFKAELAKKMKEAALDLDSTFLWAHKAQGDGSKTNASATGGIIEATTQFTDLSTAPLTLKSFLDGMQIVWQKVGTADMGKDVLLGAWQKRVINSFFQGTRRSQMSDARIKTTWDAIETDFGTFNFYIHYGFKKTDPLLVWNSADCRRKTYEGGNWITGLFSTDGWYDRGFLRGDFVGIWEAPDRRMKFINYSTTDTDYPNLDKFTA